MGGGLGRSGGGSDDCVKVTGTGYGSSVSLHPSAATMPGSCRRCRESLLGLTSYSFVCEMCLGSRKGVGFLQSDVIVPRGCIQLPGN
ncbi:hypothetical protein HBI46_169460 [Parastagonospora nodorum]|nr:hypothetical protein HBI09_123400 [Parastagonospora nodorum]KAH5002249.1 hypothetical protein HBI77_138090 [Parastagonospora nodorum]KAH5410359.1 hypothetical protein HBI46_169460 [Parastagonospora nodorum]KAH5693295.1 hypothetical protein HBI44_152490 [Parastagonospora nodorum]KAH6160074.1 hypothetical protein HBI68_127520 [Parastagonospora nodorum]